MSLLVTTQSYRNDIPTEFGLLLELDSNNGKILRTKRIDTPVKSNSDGRIKPGLRGIYIYNNEIYVATWNTIYILDLESLEIKRSLSHKWMSDLHGICVNDDGIWVTSSLPDAMIVYDFEGKPLASIWVPETFLYENRAKVDKEIDWRSRGKDFRDFHNFHTNNVEIKGDMVYITGRSSTNGRVARFKKDVFLKQGTVTDEDIELFIKNLYGPHDGLWIDHSFFLTETLGSTIAKITSSGKVDFRIKVKVNDSEVDPRSISRLRKIRKIIVNSIKNRPNLEKTTHWTRGLAVTKENFYVGQSTWAGNEKSKARVVKINRKSHEIKDAFYLEVDNYPETRIYQVLDLETALAKSKG